MLAPHACNVLHEARHHHQLKDIKRREDNLPSNLRRQSIPTQLGKVERVVTDHFLGPQELRKIGQ